LVTIDGRQEASLGMSFAEMADFLLTLGATDALNLDGGGSTAMVIDGEVVNRPSDITGERAVANVLLLVER
jgi:exopolysaccharide biosynthesis protein